MLINYSSFLAASGKTFSAIQYISKAVVLGERFIIAVPSILLAEQIKNDCILAGIKKITAFHSDDGEEGSVIPRIINHFKKTDYTRAEVVIMTINAFERLDFIHKKMTWNLIIDEVPQPIFHQRFGLNENRHHLVDLMKFENYNAKWSSIGAADDIQMISEKARNQFGDEITHYVSDVASKLLSPHWSMYAENHQLSVFQSDDQKKRCVDIFGVLEPTLVKGFKSVTIMAACFEDSLLYKLWLTRNVEFQPHEFIKGRFTQYPNANLVSVKFAMERDWSARLRDTKVDGKRIIEHVVDGFNKEIGVDPFVYLVNKDEDQLDLHNGTPLPHMSHGLNKFAGYHNAMIIPALNPPSAYFGFCSEICHIDPEEVKTAIYRTSCYQAALRISIRNLQDTNPKKIMVVDKKTADWLANVIGTSDVSCIDSAYNHKDKRVVLTPKTNAVRTNDFRNELKKQLISDLDEVNNFCVTTSFSIKEAVTQKLFHVGDVFDHKNSFYGVGTKGVTISSFKEFLADCWRNDTCEKEKLGLISPGHYNPSLSADTKRGIANIVSMSGIWLDNDGGDLTPEEFARMVKYPMVIYNSYNSVNNAKRWRVWLPTTHLMTAAVHKEMLNQIKKILRSKDYYGKSYIAKQLDKNPTAIIKHHGFDESKLTQAVLFYLPARAKAGIDHSFFDEYNWDRAPINPYKWIDRTILDQRPAVIPMEQPAQTEEIVTDIEQKIGIAKATYLAVPKGIEMRNKAFFVLGLKLMRLRLNYWEIESNLREVAIDEDRRNQIPSIISSLKNGKYNTN